MKRFAGDSLTAWEPFRPGGDRPWDLKAAGHLLRRAGFGGSWDELRRALADGPARTVDRLFRPEADLAAFHREADSFESNGDNAQALEQLRASWLRRMIATPDPLAEKMVLFWHGWFGVSATRVQTPALALAHVRMLRAQALGRFDELLLAAVSDPGVLLAYGGRENPRARPNLHLARQMLLVTVGEGEFTERDVLDTARAFTGRFVRGNQLREVPRESDDGEKTILGQTGRWNAQDFSRIAASHPATARRVAGGLFRWLISEETGDAPGALLEPLSRSFGADRDTGKLAGTMLRSNLFFSGNAYRKRVKSPVEFAVGLCRAFEGQVPALRLGRDLADLGQDLYEPPTVKGWSGGRAWINPATLAGRANLASALLVSGPYENRLDPVALTRKHGRTDPVRAAEFLGELLYSGDVPPAIRPLLEERARVAPDAANGLRGAASLLAGAPEYQLA